MKKKAFAQQLSALRTSRGLTQQQVADAIGITRGRLNNYEQGTREPDIDTLITLAEFYNTSVGALIGRDETELLRTQADEAEEALRLLKKINTLSPDKRRIIEILTDHEDCALEKSK